MCSVASPAVPGERQALPDGMQQHRAALCSSAQGGWWGLQRRQLAFCSSVDFSTHLGLNGEIYIILQCLAWSSVRQGGLGHVLISKKATSEDDI